MIVSSTRTATMDVEVKTTGGRSVLMKDATVLIEVRHESEWNVGRDVYIISLPEGYSLRERSPVPSGKKDQSKRGE